jgi:hypothetical protein
MPFAGVPWTSRRKKVHHEPFLSHAACLSIF